jgi:hypothetical protein
MFEAVEGKMYSQPGSGYGWWALHTIAKRDWQDMVID